MEDAHQALAPRGERPALQVAPGLEQLQHLVEPAGQRLGAAPDLPLEVGHLAADPLGLAGGPEVPVAVGAVGDRVGEQPGGLFVGRRATGGDRHPGRGPGRPGRCRGPGRRTRQLAQLVGHLLLEAAVVGREGHGHGDLAHDLGPIVEVVAGQAHHPAPLGEHPQPHGAALAAGDGQHGECASALRPGCWITSPGRSRARASLDLAAAGRPDGPARAPRAGTARGGDQRPVLSTSPSSHSASARASARAVSRRARRVSSRTTAWSAWNWANDRLSRWWAWSGGVAADEVGRHVVGGPERGAEREAAARGQGGHVAERTNGDHSTTAWPWVVDAPPAGPPGELGVLARRQELVALPGELGELLDDDRAGRHVDAEGQGLGGEHDLDQALDEALLDRLLERRHHPAWWAAMPGLEPGHEPVVAEDVEVAVG